MNITQHICKRCGYNWVIRVKNPKQCPKCKSYDWNNNSEKKEVKKSV